jgi:hypothetical protein
MKFIRRFNESNRESIQDIIDNIKDICLDITDGRFHVTIMNTLMKGYDDSSKVLFILLSDIRDYDGFTLKEVDEVLQRIQDYLTPERYIGCSALMVGEMHRTSINSVTYEDRISNISIHFKE